MDEDEEYGEDEGYEIVPAKFSKHVLVGAALDFLDHVHEGFGCTIARLNHAWVAHQVWEHGKAQFEHEARMELEMITSEATGGDEQA